MAPAYVNAQERDNQNRRYEDKAHNDSHYGMTPRMRHTGGTWTSTTRNTTILTKPKRRNRPTAGSGATAIPIKIDTDAAKQCVPNSRSAETYEECRVFL